MSGVDEDNALKLGQDVVQLRGVGLQELSAGRDVEEEVLHRKVAALRTGHRLLALHLGGGQHDARAQLVARPGASSVPPRPQRQSKPGPRRETPSCGGQRGRRRYGFWRWRGRSKERRASVALMPQPLSITCMLVFPASVTKTCISVAPASMAFSTSSFITEAGRCITSPAAI